mmetsp:Transcript_123536/g.349252  ORF Transcript_123536/g.349252 Transcript_123536/m.349252 type:complete len:448 (-) Transcript_123536:139-1482(-)
MRPISKLLGAAVLVQLAGASGLLDFRSKFTLDPGSTPDQPTLRLVVRTWQQCQWAWAMPITEELRAKLGGSEGLSAVRRCGNSIRTNCRFYTASVFQSSTGLDAQRLGFPLLVGYLVTDAMWEEKLDVTAADCADATSFVGIRHPLQALHPDGFGPWIGARMAELGLDFDASMKAERLDEVLVEALPDVCTDDTHFTDLWDALWPGEQTAEQMIIVGCADMGDEPTASLLDKGAGGLFLDGNMKAVQRARERQPGSHRLILNATVSPSNVQTILRTHAPFARRVDVLQVDIDSADGPVVQRLLEVVSPRAVVVEFREFVPFPLRYSFLDVDTDGLPWGGANLAFWMRELKRSGYELTRMNGQDAAFVRGLQVPDPPRRALSILACYLRRVLQLPSPSSLFRGLGQGGSADWTFLWHTWMAAAPSAAVGDAWRNLTQWRSDLRFFLDI